MRTFKVAVEWTMTTIVEVECDTLYEAIECACDDPELPLNGEYLGDSFLVNMDLTEELNIERDTLRNLPTEEDLDDPQ